MKLRAQPTLVSVRESFGLILNIARKNDCVGVTLIFYPGGDYWREITHDLMLYGGNNFNEKISRSCQFYVFYPGGNNFNEKRKSFDQFGKHHVIPCFVYNFSLILEDKDRFKMRVLMRSKNEIKGSLVIFTLFLIFQGN